MKTCAGLIAVLVAVAAATSAAADCKVRQMAALPVTPSFLRPTIHAKINGADVRLLADSGAFFSVLSPGTVAEYKLPVRPGPYGAVMRGYGGETSLSITRVHEFDLDASPLKDLEFAVGGSEIGPGLAGVVGRNILDLADSEFDLANGVIRLMRPVGCGGASMAYWAAGKTVYAVPMVTQFGRFKPAAVIRVSVNGKSFDAVLDSGAATSFITLSGATRAGLATSGPSISAPGQSGGFGRKLQRSFATPVSDIKIGDEEVRATRLRVVETEPLGGDVVLGSDFFLSHRIFIANSQGKVYFTYNGGPVFNLVAKPIDGSDAPTPKSAGDGVAVLSAGSPPSPEPADAAGFSRRGAAYASRRDYPAAMADLDRAVTMAPENADYVYQRATVRLANGQVFLAMADLDRTLKLRPGDNDALLARAQLRIAGHDREEGLADLAGIDASVPPAADVRLRLGELYARSERFDDAVKQFGLWIAAHPDDNRRPQALSERCRAHALLGVDLEKALGDCDGAHRATPRNAYALESRGLIHLRLGHFDKAIADFDAAVAIQPKRPWSLYGRSLAKAKAGDAAGATSDRDAATGLDATIAERLAKWGIK